VLQDDCTTEVVTSRLTLAEAQALRALAREGDRNVSRQIRRAIREQIQNENRPVATGRFEDQAALERSHGATS
jgi:hypothetical protein